MWIKIKTDVINLNLMEGIILGETKITFIGNKIIFTFMDKKHFPKDGNLTTKEFQELKEKIIKILEWKEGNFEEIIKEE